MRIFFEFLSLLSFFVLEEEVHVPLRYESDECHVCLRLLRPKEGEGRGRGTYDRWVGNKWARRPNRQNGDRQANRCFVRMGMLGCGPVKYSLHQGPESRNNIWLLTVTV